MARNQRKGARRARVAADASPSVAADWADGLKIYSAIHPTGERAKTNRRRAERSVSESRRAGRDALLSIRLTPQLKAAIQKTAAAVGVSLSDFLEDMYIEYTGKKSGGQ
jgi:hypothetical protein